MSFQTFCYFALLREWNSCCCCAISYIGVRKTPGCWNDNAGSVANITSGLAWNGHRNPSSCYVGPVELQPNPFSRHGTGKKDKNSITVEEIIQSFIWRCRLSMEETVAHKCIL